MPRLVTCASMGLTPASKASPINRECSFVFIINSSLVFLTSMMNCFTVPFLPVAQWKCNWKAAADVGYSPGVQPSRRKSRFFQVYTMTAGILSLPKLSDGFGRVVEPVAVGEQRDQFDGTEKLHRIRVWPAQWGMWYAFDNATGNSVIHAHVADL